MEEDNEIKKIGDGISNFFLVQVHYTAVWFPIYSVFGCITNVFLNCESHYAYHGSRNENSSK